MPGEGAKFFPTWYQVGKSSGRLEPSCSSPPAWLIYQPEQWNMRVCVCVDMNLYLCMYMYEPVNTSKKP